MTAAFQWLNRPLQLNRLTLKHRMIMGPMGNRLWTADGEPGPGLIELYVARVRGGVSMVTVGTGQAHAGYVNGYRPALWRDDNIPNLRRVSDAIHAGGVPAVIQLQHDGPGATPAVSPSGVPCLTISKPGLVESRALGTDEVIDMREQFIAASQRAQRAGFDGVEIGGQAGYLLGQFFSARMNLRTDQYGGNEENRMRLATEIVRGVRERCGKDFVIGYAMSVAEMKPGGNTLDDSVPFARALEAAGLDYLDVRVGTHDTFALSDKVTGHNRYQSREGIWSFSARMKQAVAIPVFCSTQGSYDPQRWEQALAAGETDVIQLGKPLLADAAVVDKMLRGVASEARPCTYCMWCLDPKRFFSQQSTPRTYCTVNVEVGAPDAPALTPAFVPRRVVVVGGGPAGLEAARTLARRGHRVTLLERQAQFGGQLTELARCPGSDVYQRLGEWLVDDCRAAGVVLRAGESASLSTVRRLDPEVLILATGGAPAAVSIRGADRAHVLAASAVLAGQARVGTQVVIIGGGMVGVQVAGLLAAGGGKRSITLLEPDKVPELAYGLSKMEQTFTQMTLLPKYGVEARIGVRVEDIRERDLTVIDEFGEREKLKADTVVIALERTADTAAAAAWQDLKCPVHVLGEAAGGRGIGDAIHDAGRLARQV